MGLYSYVVDYVLDPINCWLTWALSFLKACKISSQQTRPENLVLQRFLTSFSAFKSPSWTYSFMEFYSSSILHIFFVPHQFGLFTWLRRGISMLWNENACKFCREAIGAVAYRQAGHPTPTPCLHNPSAIQGRQGTSIPLGRRRPGPPKATQLK